MNILLNKNVALAILAISLVSCASSPNGEQIKSLISSSPDLEVATKTELQATEEVPQSSPNLEENKNTIIAKSSVATKKDTKAFANPIVAEEETTKEKSDNKQSQPSNTATKSSGGNLIGLEETPSPNKEMIIDLNKRGVFDNLYWDFNLLEPITRSQYITILYYANNALRPSLEQIRLAPAYDPNFTDIDSSHPAYKYVQALANAGYSVGYEDNTFKPDQPITREEMIGTKVPLDLGNTGDIDRQDIDRGISNFSDYKQIDPKFRSDIYADFNFIQGDKGNNLQRSFGSIKSLKPKQEVWGYEAAASLWQFGDSEPSPDFSASYDYPVRTAVEQPE